MRTIVAGLPAVQVRRIVGRPFFRCQIERIGGRANPFRPDSPDWPDTDPQAVPGLRFWPPGLDGDWRSPRRSGARPFPSRSTGRTEEGIGPELHICSATLSCRRVSPCHGPVSPADKTKAPGTRRPHGAFRRGKKHRRFVSVTLSAWYPGREYRQRCTCPPWLSPSAGSRSSISRIELRRNRIQSLHSVKKNLAIRMKVSCSPSCTTGHQVPAPSINQSLTGLGPPDYLDRVNLPEDGTELPVGGGSRHPAGASYHDWAEAANWGDRGFSPSCFPILPAWECAEPGLAGQASRPSGAGKGRLPTSWVRGPGRRTVS